MFEDTLLIIKADYMSRKKLLLLKILKNGFQIQAQRKLRFSPEFAAEFLQQHTDRKDFMLQVILLTKGNAEAFILTKQSAVRDLNTTMICYFGSSGEMEKNVHITQRPEDVKHEISFIFPNYIKEPVKCFERHRFDVNPIIRPLVEELYELTRAADAPDQSDESNWRIKLAKWFALSDSALPCITNQAIIKPSVRQEEKGQQVKFVGSAVGGAGDDAGSGHLESMPSPGHSSMMPSSKGSSVIMSSSSCMTCSGFGDTALCMHQVKSETPTREALEERILARTAEPLKSTTGDAGEPAAHGEGLEWRETSEEGSECAQPEE